jgi:FkbM family methyltransferase
MLMVLFSIYILLAIMPGSASECLSCDADVDASDESFALLQTAHMAEIAAHLENLSKMNEKMISHMVINQKNRLADALAHGNQAGADDFTHGNQEGAEASSTCLLPEGASWCTAKPATGRNFQIAVYKGHDFVSQSICENGYWEVQDLSSLGTPGTALDIGANVGFYSFLLADAGWQVHSFEAMQRNQELIQATACQNPQLAEKIKLHRTGLGPHDDECVFISDNENLGDGIVHCGDEAKRMRSGQTPVQKGYEIRGSFPIKRLDDILMQKEAPTSIDFVKIDVEGFECQVFKGAESILKHYRPRMIQSEVWSQMQHCLSQDYLNMFKQANYVVSQTRDCKESNSTLSGQIQDFFMCSKSTVLLQLS